MMIKKNLMYFLSLSGIIIGLSACMGAGGNSSSYTSLAVIANDATGGVVMNTGDGPIAAPGLAGTELRAGSCIIARFTIDYDNQPSSTVSQYYTATDITYQLLTNAAAKIVEGDMPDAYNDSIYQMSISFSPYYNGNLFVTATRTVSDSKMCEFELICNPDSISDDGVHTVFLKLHKSDITAGSATNTNWATFNLNGLFAAYGKDSVYTDSSTKDEVYLRYLPLNMKYQSGTKGGVPVYSRLGTTPVKLINFR